MAGKDGSSGGGGNSSGGGFSWAGGSSPSTIDPKTFGTKLLGDLNTAYGQGPKINPVSPYTPLSSQTQGLIGQATANAAPGGVLSQYANGSMIGQGNPYLDAYLNKTNADITGNVDQSFASNGRYGSDIHTQALTDALANADNTARFGQYNTDVGNMFQAQGAQQNNLATALNASGLTDQNAAQQTAANSTMWDRTNNAPFNNIAQYLALANNPQNTGNTNQPTSLWNILGSIGSIAGSFF